MNAAGAVVLSTRKTAVVRVDAVNTLPGSLVLSCNIPSPDRHLQCSDDFTEFGHPRASSAFVLCSGLAVQGQIDLILSYLLGICKDTRQLFRFTLKISRRVC
eukprot:NODE_1977_length_1168_cov_45.869356_g1960_i0.p2 GENE.NODE_1977_length_1168_cov_45.869356_g1960_i0~~NODE_1977_length_1168_cov_45.869356_g1960_i0.p2  ORF type:complete len:102 (+),score=4.36 NODE_1977_length_1168_cov_45.869356_g1960_i0:453-758(+)